MLILIISLPEASTCPNYLKCTVSLESAVRERSSCMFARAGRPDPAEECGWGNTRAYTHNETGAEETCEY